MEQIKDSRRNILIHEDATENDIPVEELPQLPALGGVDEFVPANMSEPKLYAGDIIVGVYDDTIRFAELIYKKVGDGVLVVPLNSGGVTLKGDQQFSRRFYQADEVHVYDSVVDEIVDWNVEFDESKLTRPGTSRA